MLQAPSDNEYVWFRHAWFDRLLRQASDVMRFKEKNPGRQTRCATCTHVTCLDAWIRSEHDQQPAWLSCMIVMRWKYTKNVLPSRVLLAEEAAISRINARLATSDPKSFWICPAFSSSSQLACQWAALALPIITAPFNFHNSKVAILSNTCNTCKIKKSKWHSKMT